MHLHAKHRGKILEIINQSEQLSPQFLTLETFALHAKHWGKCVELIDQSGVRIKWFERTHTFIDGNRYQHILKKRMQ